MNQFPIERFRQLPTPFYYYDLQLLDRTLAAAVKAAGNFCLHYAMKANPDVEVMRHVAAHGLGVDTVSGGELQRALDCGIPAEKIVFAGVGKTDAELRVALSAGIGCLNAESIEELEVIEQIAAEMGKTAPVALRVNPNIDAHTHEYITTGLVENKFGIDRRMLDAAIDRVLASKHLHLRGLHFHIGSQITVTEPLVVLCERINELQDRYNPRGIFFETINVGGGQGIDYDDPDANPVPDFESFYGTFRQHLHLREGQTLHFEPGRSLVAQCGTLVTRVVLVKKGIEKQYVICDAGMNDLIRPALYGSHHCIQNITSDGASEVYDVVGPVCESSDCFGHGVTLPATHRGDLLAIRSAGAYGRIMASQYNLRPVAPVITNA